jgi:hypothetical protein
MEIIIDDEGSAKFYDESLSVAYNRKKLIKNPKKKLYGLSFNAKVLTITSAIILAVLKILSVIYPDGYYGYISIIFIFTLAYGAFYYFKVRNRISELKNQDNRRLIIEKDYVELVSDERHKMPISKIRHIIINRNTISFIPKDGDEGIIIISSDYKKQILDGIDSDGLIVDNVK